MTSIDRPVVMKYAHAVLADQNMWSAGGCWTVVRDLSRSGALANALTDGRWSNKVSAMSDALIANTVGWAAETGMDDLESDTGRMLVLSDDGCTLSLYEPSSYNGSREQVLQRFVTPTVTATNFFWNEAQGTFVLLKVDGAGVSELRLDVEPPTMMRGSASIESTAVRVASELSEWSPLVVGMATMELICQVEFPLDFLRAVHPAVHFALISESGSVAVTDEDLLHALASATDAMERAIRLEALSQAISSVGWAQNPIVTRSLASISNRDDGSVTDVDALIQDLGESLSDGSFDSSTIAYRRHQLMVAIKMFLGPVARGSRMYPRPWAHVARAMAEDWASTRQQLLTILRAE